MSVSESVSFKHNFLLGSIWAKRGLAQRISLARFGLGPRVVTRGAAARSDDTVGLLDLPRERSGRPGTRGDIGVTASFRFLRGMWAIRPITGQTGNYA